MWFSVALVRFHWFGINWHVFHQSECRDCCLYIIIQNIAPQAKSGKYFQIWCFPRFGGKKWRRSEHAHASYPGLFFRPAGFSPFMGREERRVQGLDYRRLRFLNFRPLVTVRPRPHVSGYFLIRNFFFPDTATVHTNPANSTANPETNKSALQSGKNYIRNESDNVWTGESGYFFIRWRKKRVQSLTEQ